ncbi:MAG: hypothetical protein J7480_06345 [Microbacteriaceae bacterium]|nr:hypothetical protein [Microbacteriaceae bacterium]
MDVLLQLGDLIAALIGAFLPPPGSRQDRRMLAEGRARGALRRQGDAADPVAGVCSLAPGRLRFEPGEGRPRRTVTELEVSAVRRANVSVFKQPRVSGADATLALTTPRGEFYLTVPRRVADGIAARLTPS